MKNLREFLAESESLPELYMDMVLVEARRPILFVCKDRDEEVYIVSCHCSNGEKSEWLIQKTTHAKLIELLTDKITVRDIFVKGYDDLFVATLCAGQKKATVFRRNLQDIEDRVLPTAGFYMEAEDGEFEEELEILQAAQKASYEFTSTRFNNRIRTIMRSFPMYITIPAPDQKIINTEYYSSNQRVNISVS